MGKVRDPNKENKKGTKYAPKLAAAIAKANTMHRDRSKAGRLQSAAIAEIQKGEAKQVKPTASSIASMGKKLEADRGGLIKSAKDNNLSSTGLNDLANINRKLGFNETAGMNLGQSLKYQATRPEMKRDLQKTADNLRRLPTFTNIILQALGGSNKGNTQKLD
jgi:O-succinylbenzoate synthase